MPKQEHVPLTEETVNFWADHAGSRWTLLGRMAQEVREARRLLRAVDTEVAVVHPDSMAEEIEAYLAACEGKEQP